MIQIHKNKKQGSILISQMNHFGNELESNDIDAKFSDTDTRGEYACVFR